MVAFVNFSNKREMMMMMMMMKGKIKEGNGRKRRVKPVEINFMLRRLCVLMKYMWTCCCSTVINAADSHCVDHVDLIAHVSLASTAASRQVTNDVES